MKITCKRCGDDTNMPPPELPKDWQGYCPKCAFAAMSEGEITQLTKEQFLEALMAACGGMLVGIGMISNEGDTVVIPDEGGVHVHAKLSLN